ncbi:hypothetical protein FGO68_gene9014 [Halteria grandinella]|uniref:Uncharacterized protein n=1 Tax=Halteria grandinella TaxID=5974 RepID=A0A8J8NPY2_HALGN|nr:hypothetical protein FGO68_gene9014 [Halteria grandinella]
MCPLYIVLQKRQERQGVAISNGRTNDISSIYSMLNLLQSRGGSSAQTTQDTAQSLQKETDSPASGLQQLKNLLQMHKPTETPSPPLPSTTGLSQFVSCHNNIPDQSVPPALYPIPTSKPPSPNGSGHGSPNKDITEPNQVCDTMQKLINAMHIENQKPVELTQQDIELQKKRMHHLSYTRVKSFTGNGQIHGDLIMPKFPFKRLKTGEESYQFVLDSK